MQLLSNLFAMIRRHYYYLAIVYALDVIEVSWFIAR
jgi:hypothetical protein